MVIMLGCILSFLAGAGCVVYTLNMTGASRETESFSSDLKSQWEEFLNYNGEE